MRKTATSCSLARAQCGDGQVDRGEDVALAEPGDQAGASESVEHWLARVCDSDGDAGSVQRVDELSEGLGAGEVEVGVGAGKGPFIRTDGT